MDAVPWVQVERLATYVVELVVLIFIYRELRELKRHSVALAQHQGKLDQVRPLISTLYTDPDDILRLAIEFTRSAKSILAVGTISVLGQTEIRRGEGEQEWKNRVSQVPPLRREYAAATLDFIQSGRPYSRVMNFTAGPSPEPEYLPELWANVRFFLRLLEDEGARGMDLNLYHDPILVAGKEDLHYRVSDSSVIIRVGGPARAESNAAIAIKDTKVVEAFSTAYAGILSRPLCASITLDVLRNIDQCLATKDLDGLENVLEELRQ